MTPLELATVEQFNTQVMESVSQLKPLPQLQLVWLKFVVLVRIEQLRTQVAVDAFQFQPFRQRQELTPLLFEAPGMFWQISWQAAPFQK